MPRLSSQDRGIAVGLLQAHVSAREVARRLGCSHVTVLRLLERHQETNSVADRPRAGRPRVTTHIQDQQMVENQEQHPFEPAVRTALAVSVSPQTVRRRLHDAGLRARRPYIGPVLTQQHRQRRLLWARRCVRYTRRQWSTVAFSDESRFNISFADGRHRVWRRQNTRYNGQNVMERDRFGGGSVMVWGAFSSEHRTLLHVFQGTVTGLRYRDEVLVPFVVPFFEDHQDLATFQHDNARAHTSRVAVACLEEANIEVMQWPALSPDMAPIEHAWDELGRRIRNGPQPRTQVELANALVREWNLIPQDFFRNLVRSMRRRCIDCINAAGGHTRY